MIASCQMDSTAVAGDHAPWHETSLAVDSRKRPANPKHGEIPTGFANRKIACVGLTASAPHTQPATETDMKWDANLHQPTEDVAEPESLSPEAARLKIRRLKAPHELTPLSEDEKRRRKPPPPVVLMSALQDRPEFEVEAFPELFVPVPVSSSGA